jgi:hypothetical protein
MCASFWPRIRFIEQTFKLTLHAFSAQGLAFVRTGDGAMITPLMGFVKFEAEVRSTITLTR